eukprot:CAMPEP_0194110856 /NCGR_PEP_ID=MMETSP0150-20130528/10005_1 /TAXON_ID=122233 /ORGANISM="Chaetoceros debilis, Strain MM31A-1" /LENGTH=423 /DNA_ID=CAMNT_0038800143 /DNA_START=201 /DNA_END=1472 /DNA_ORIENTATION=+
MPVKDWVKVIHDNYHFPNPDRMGVIKMSSKTGTYARFNAGSNENVSPSKIAGTRTRATNSLRFNEKELLDALRGNKILFNQMQQRENECGMFAEKTRIKKSKDRSNNHKLNYYLAATVLPDGTNCTSTGTLASGTKDVSKRGGQTSSTKPSPSRRSRRQSSLNITAKSPSKTWLQFLEEPVDPSTLKLTKKHYFPRDLIQRAMDVKEPEKKMAPMKKIDPFSEELMNGPKLPEGVSIYWDSTESRKHFSASDDETTLDAINKRISALRKALSSHNGYKDIVEVQSGTKALNFTENNADENKVVDIDVDNHNDGGSEHDLTQAEIHEVRVRMQVVIMILKIAMDHMPDYSIFECVKEAWKSIGEFYDMDSLNWPLTRVRKWYNEFRLTGKFCFKRKEKKQSRKRKRNSNPGTTASTTNTVLPTA